LRFPPTYNAAHDRCQDPEKLARIEQLLHRETGHKCNVRVEALTAGADNGDSSARIAGPPENSQSRVPPPRDEASETPLVQWAKDLLGAKLIKADPGFGVSAHASRDRAPVTDPREA
jgi:hypothetical protein